jgi:hypothetical protein
MEDGGWRVEMGTDCVEHWSRLGADQRNMDELGGGRQVLCVAAASYGGSPMSGMEESSDGP